MAKKWKKLATVCRWATDERGSPCNLDQLWQNEAPLADEESHMTSKQKLFTTMVPGQLCKAQNSG